MTVKWKVEVDIADLLIFQMALESLYSVAHQCHAELERKEGREKPGDIMFTFESLEEAATKNLTKDVPMIIKELESIVVRSLSISMPWTAGEADA
tara:strand:- start:140 stop:424 length:285 start_codon:yes stop_codon:yes gene_type:complete